MTAGTPVSRMSILTYSESYLGEEELNSEEEYSCNLGRYRNILVRDLSNEVVAGLIQRDGVSFKTLHRWLNMIFLIEAPWYFSADQQGDNRKLRSCEDTSVIPEGHYKIVNSEGEPIAARPLSFPIIRRVYSPGSRSPPTFADENYTNSVNDRDGVCCINGLPVYRPEEGQNCPAVRIFPLSHYSEWLTLDWCKDLEGKDDEDSKLLSLLSPRNGITLLVGTQSMFESYQVAVDVDDGYRLIQLSPNTIPLFNTRESLTLIRNTSVRYEDQVSDVLLREHLRQALLKYVRGDGSDTDFKWETMCERLLFEDENIDLSESKWVSGTGKEVIERYLAMQLFGCLPCVLACNSDSELEGARWSRRRREFKYKLKTPPEEEDWPESFDTDDDFKLPQLVFEYGSFNDPRNEKFKQPFRGDWDPNLPPLVDSIA